jgi:hypothetical protein
MSRVETIGNATQERANMSDEEKKHKAPWPCIICAKILENLVHPDSIPNQPVRACTFTTSGHYGSTVFDEIDGAKLEVNICDDCLIAAQKRLQIGYWPSIERRRQRTWKGE